MTVRHVTLLPEPLSPTSPTNSPRRSVNETSSTARTTPPSVRMNVCKPSTRRISSAATSDTASASLICTQQVGQAVADEAEPDTDDDDRDPRQRREPPGAEDVVLPVGDHRPPLRRRRLRAEPEEPERRAEEDVPDGVDHREDQYERDDVRKDVPQHHAAVPVAERLRREDVLPTLREHRVPARDARVADPAREPDRDEHVEDARPQHRDDRDHQDEEREREEEVDDAHDHRVDPTADVPREEADRGPDDQRHARGPEGDQQVDAPAVEDAREHVAPELVGAQWVTGGERRGERVERVEGVRVVRRQQRRRERRHDHDPEDRAPRDQRRVADEPPAPPARTRLEALEQQCAGIHRRVHSATTRGSSDACTTSVTRLIATTRNARTSVTPCTTG